MIRLLWTLALAWLLQGTAANPSCPTSPDGMLTVHLVCHTHDDVGWLKTVDQYFYGANNNIQRAGVQYILDSVMDELSKDSSRKFSYVEMAFFYRWWMEQTQETKDKVKSFVASGQLEFLNGGWCMNDEAAAHYTAIVDQMTLGLTFINQTFGQASRPRVAWQIDPFGHSNAQASLFAQMGYDGLFFGRLDFADKDKRWTAKQLEMVWQASKTLGEAGSLFTGALPDGYGPPGGFCFDDTCGDQPIMDDPRMHDYNVDQRVDDFLAAVADHAKAYRSSNIIMTMGSDFQYQNARTWYKNLDKLIKYVNARQQSGSRVHVVYSTPSCYLDSVHSDGITWGTKQDDFFPYASDHHAYWTGYFTSRPAFKGYIRQTNAFLQALKQTMALRNMGRGPSLDHLAMAMGVVQHHDAVSGTAKQAVTDDYAMRLATAEHLTTQNLADTLRTLSRGNSNTKKNEENVDIAISFCPLVNISACIFTETKETFQLIVYNSIARPLSKYMRIPVPENTAYKVTDYQGTGITSQLVPIPPAVLSLPYRNSSATHELVFLADGVPALGTATYTISRTSFSPTMEQLRSTERRGVQGQDMRVEQGPMSVTLDGRTGLIKSIAIRTAAGVKEQQVKLELMWYAGMAGDNSQEQNRASGAYVFRPNGTDPIALGPATNVVYEGALVNEIQQQFAPWASQVIRMYKGYFHVEVEWMIGPIPIGDGVGKEIISRYTLAGVTTNGTFFTDANGREMQKRVKNYRETWTLNVTEPVSGNYYPVTSRIIINSTNDKGSFAVLNDRAQGGSSLAEGQVELMLHRRLLHDDSFGVGEALNETAFGDGLVVRGTQLLVHSDFASADCDFFCLHRSLGEAVLMRPVTMFQEITPAGEERAPVPPVSGLISPLPVQVHLMTLEPWYEENQQLLRLEHMFAKDEGTKSVPVTVDIQNLLSAWKITSAAETVLSANQWLADSKRLQWAVANRSSSRASDRRNLKGNAKRRFNHNNIGDYRRPGGNNGDYSYGVVDDVAYGYDASNDIRRPSHSTEDDYSYGVVDDVAYGYDASNDLRDVKTYEDFRYFEKEVPKVLRRFSTRFQEPPRNRETPRSSAQNLNVTLAPMQIRTFIVTVELRQ